MTTQICSKVTKKTPGQLAQYKKKMVKFTEEILNEKLHFLCIVETNRLIYIANQLIGFYVIKGCSGFFMN